MSTGRLQVLALRVAGSRGGRVHAGRYRLGQPRSATLGILDGAGHHPLAECPAKLVPVVTSFLAEHVDA